MSKLEELTDRDAYKELAEAHQDHGGVLDPTPDLGLAAFEEFRISAQSVLAARKAYEDAARAHALVIKRLHEAVAPSE